MASLGHQPLPICDLKKGHFSPFPLLKIELCQELELHDWQQMAELFKLAPGEIDAITNRGAQLSTLYFLRSLEAKNVLSPSSVDGFIAALERVDCTAMANKVRKYKQDHIEQSPDSSGAIQSSSEQYSHQDHGPRPAGTEGSHGHVGSDLSFGTLDIGAVWDGSPLTPSVVSSNGGSPPVVVLRLEVADRLGTSGQVCFDQLSQIKDSIWRPYRGTVDHLSGSVMVISRYGKLEQISEGSLLFHVAVPSLQGLVGLRNDVSTGRLAEALQQEMCEDMSIEMGGGLRLVVSLDSQSVDSAYNTLKPDAESGDLQSNKLFCDYCKIIFDKEWQHKHHISRCEHNDRIAPRQGHGSWTSRDPPRGITNGKFEYCREFIVLGACSSARECQFAHSVAEYEEWTARHQDCLKVIETISKQEMPTARKKGDSKPQSRWDNQIKTFAEEHEAKRTTQVGSSLYYLESDCEDDLIDDKSAIFLGEYKSQKVAVKVIPKRDIGETVNLFTTMEGHAMSNVLKMVCVEKKEVSYYVATPLCEYDLSHVIGAEAKQIQAGKSLSPEKRVRMCVQVLTGLQSLHSLGIIHRDLKPRNILIDENGEAVLTDFGISRNMAGKSTRWTGVWGTQYWMASEICTTGDANSVRYKKSSDIQVAGYLIYFILSDGHHPFETTHPFDQDHVAFLTNLKDGQYRLDHIGDYPPECKALLEKMLKTEQEQRPKIDECLKEMKDVLEIYTTRSQTNPVPNSDISLAMCDFGVTCDKHHFSVSVPRRTKVNWSFRISCLEKPLQRVYLWHHHAAGLQFHLSQPANQNRSRMISHGEMEREPDGSVCVEVHYKSKGPGLSDQWVIFDFGEKWVLCRQLLAWVGTEFAEKLPQLGDTSAPFENVIPYPTAKKPDKFCEGLEKRYLPGGISAPGTGKSLTPGISKEFFHQMVAEEEHECDQRLKKYNGIQRMEVSTTTSGCSAEVMLPEGSLFGNIHLRKGLDDSGESQVVLKFVHTVLLQFEGDDEVAYEAAIVDDKDFDLRERDRFYVTLSEECVQKQCLQDGDTLEVDVQMQLDRMSFCIQHFAVDNLQNSQILFPPKNMFPRFATKHPVGLQASAGDGDADGSYQLNPRQEGAKNFITRATDITPFRQGPSLIIGPFGTGKTFTLAETIRAIIMSDETSKLLICTQSDSAADPILDHLEDIIEKGWVLQIHPHDTDINSVPSTAMRKNRKKYCLFESGSRNHAKPNKKVVMKKRVVLATFSTSIYLVELEGLRGKFTHIIIDEAGQALETETMIPLGLAGPRTVVVMVGDHKQLRPEVFSVVARRWGYHKSMLERLFYWSKDNNCYNTLILTDNYRMRQEILDFIGQHCYDIQGQFRAVKEFADDIPRSYPIAFSAAVGEEQVTGISYKNDLEAKEILRQIEELRSSWHAEKRFEDVSIAVLTPYVHQVEHIDSLVRERKLVNVTVNTVQNVQGSQFEVVFISPVRTRKLLEEGQVTEDKYLGMLSDEGELITAFTRARSLLFAVGDPIALCRSGACSRIWKAYLRECKEHDSMERSPLPSDSVQGREDQEDLASILSEEVDVSSPAGRIRYASGNRSKEYLSESRSGEESDTEVEFAEYDDDLYDEILEGIESALKEASMAGVEHGEGVVPVVGEENLAKEDLGGEGLVEDSESNVDVGFVSRKRRKLQYRLPEGDEVHWVRLVDKADRSRLESGYKEETEEEAEDWSDMTTQEHRDKFLGMAKVDPRAHPTCVISLSEYNMALAIPSTGFADRIILRGKLMIKRALDGDQVGVKILREKEGVRYGEVMCIFRRAEDLKWKKFVCTLDEDNVGLMRPIAYSNIHYYPRMYIFPDGAKKVHNGIRFGIYSINPQSPSNKIQHEEDVFVKFSEMSGKLYLVQYSEWFPDTPHPMGIVTKELPPCRTLREGIAILRWRHSVKEKWPTPVRKVVRDNPLHWGIAPGEYEGRQDFRSRSVFTLSKCDYRDQDCAFQAEVQQDGKIQLAIHLSDVAHFVERGSEEDKEAFRRGSSFFDGFATPSHMIPEKLSTDLCLLKPGEDRLAVSIILTCNPDANVEDVQVVRSQVCCVCNLSLSDVENFLLNENDGRSDLPDKPEVMLQLEVLAGLTSAVPGAVPVSLTTEEDYVNFPLAYTLLYKLTVMGNKALKEKLQNVPGGSIVLRQQPPTNEDRDGWCDAYQGDADKLLNPPHLNFPGRRKLAGEDVPVMEPTCGEITRILTSGKDKILELRRILEGTDGFPKQAVALNQLRRIIPGEEFVCTGGVTEKLTHFSMHEERVYSFMAPLRSYLDLVIQRMLIAFVIQGSPDPYAIDDELRHIAHHCYRQLHNARIYEESVQQLSLAFKLQKIPHHLPALVQSASEERLEFSFPFISYLKAGHKSTHVPLRHLKPGQRPGDGDIRGKSIKLNWRNRIYSQEPEHLEAVPQDQNIWLSTDSLVDTVPSKLWESMIKAVREQDHESLEDIARKWQAPRASTSQSGNVREISCEKVVTPSGSLDIKKYVEFNRQFHPGHVVELQLCSHLVHGIPDLKTQLFKLTPKFDICLEHRALPVECFTEVADRLPPCFTSMEDYISAWSPVLKMLITYTTIMEDETILIHDVPVRWSKEDGNSPKVLGQFTLDKKWCEDRQIIVSNLPRKKRSKSGRRMQPDPDEEVPALTSDYVCVRLHDHKLTGEDRVCLEKFECKQRRAILRTAVLHPEVCTLVVHGIAGRVIAGQPKDAEFYKILFEVTQTSCELPDQLYKGNPVVCTVEMIPKPEPMKRMETALAGAGTCGDLIESIVLQKQCPEGDELAPYIREGKKMTTMKLTGFDPNKSQQEAIIKALTQPFTAIQGPPGTGKTKTGAYITILFYLVNREVAKRAQGGGPKRQILYCGPSNKSVDVITNDLRILRERSKKTDLKFVRVYSDMIEQREYPIQGVESAEMKFNYEFQDTEEEIKEFALHHLIQTEAGKKGAEMMEMYGKLQSGELQPNLENIRAYKKLMWEAKVIVLAKKDVILCTCSAAGSGLLKQNLTNVVQCIIDEAGMCMELETLVPFVSQTPKQVVLIGDHKQLRPIIQERRVKQLGAEKSLMEKYAGTAQSHSLTIQYRMHEAICKFPSEQFYDSRLETYSKLKNRKAIIKDRVWPGPSHLPRVFCQIVGEEDSLTVRTSEGNENSKSNEIEAKEAVRIAKILTGPLGVKFKDLVILSQYRLQCKKIRQLLHNPHITVQTITKSQGSEWDYVILSTVRSLPEEDIPEIPGRGWRRMNLGFIEDENQMNVGLTRAKRGLIIVGNKNLLVTCKTWKKLVESYEATGSVVDADQFLRY